MTDSKTCANPACGRTFTKAKGDRQWNRREYCDEACYKAHHNQRRRESYAQHGRQWVPKKQRQHVCHETQLGRYEVKNPIILGFLQGNIK